MSVLKWLFMLPGGDTQPMPATGSTDEMRGMQRDASKFEAKSPQSAERSWMIWTSIERSVPRAPLLTSGGRFLAL
jgi:hypothetical protein